MDWLTESNYWISRFLIQRGLGVIYLIAFVVTLNQFRPLLGEQGLLPVRDFLKGKSFKELPTLFHWHYSDRLLVVVSWLGIVLSTGVLLGIPEQHLWLSILVWGIMWFLYLSIVNVGQIFYGYGWESLLLEAGFYAIFLGPAHYHAPILVILLLRWLVFRVEFGAGLIKMWGDSCWQDLTCLYYHHETQHLPNPLSRFFHSLPKPLHTAETFFNHVVQLGAVWLLFLPQSFSSAGALSIIISQGYLIISRNYAWLNWITLLLAFSGISDNFLSVVLPLQVPESLGMPSWYLLLLLIVVLAVVYLSIRPIANMISPNQRMNASFNPWHLVNTYGAFGTVTRRRKELLIEGTRDSAPDERAKWKPYQFKGKPTVLAQIPPQIAPYHLRLDWQMWFAALSNIRMNPWLIKFVTKLLQNDSQTLSLLYGNPFPPRTP